MEPLEIIKKYYDEDSELYRILTDHSYLVTEKALKIARENKEFCADEKFIGEAGMLHDIGIFMTDAPEIACYGTMPYICHGYLGSELLHKENLPLHALVCERHTGTGLSLDEIIRQGLPLPHRDMQPVSLEEQIVCFADKFFSKSRPGKEKSVERVRKGLERYGEASVARFDQWCRLFLT